MTQPRWSDTSTDRTEFSAGGVVVRGREVIVIVPVKRDAHGNRVLGLPKGHPDGDETAEAAAARFPGHYRVVSEGIDPEIFVPGHKRELIVLVRDGEQVHALHDVCSHAEVPLNEGEVTRVTKAAPQLMQK